MALGIVLSCGLIYLFIFQFWSCVCFGFPSDFCIYILVSSAVILFWLYKTSFPVPCSRASRFAFELLFSCVCASFSLWCCVVYFCLVCKSVSIFVIWLGTVVRYFCVTCPFFWCPVYVINESQYLQSDHNYACHRWQLTLVFHWLLGTFRCLHVGWFWVLVFCLRLR